MPIEESIACQAVGDCMEPVLFAGDLLQLSPVTPDQLVEGRIYAYEHREAARIARFSAHRFVRHTKEGLCFRDDRHRNEELVRPETSLWEVVRVLDRKYSLAACELLDQLLSLPQTLAGLPTPKNACANWPWEDLIRLSQNKGVTAQLIRALQAHCFWDYAPSDIQERASAHCR